MGIFGTVTYRASGMAVALRNLELMEEQRLHTCRNGGAFPKPSAGFGHPLIGEAGNRAPWRSGNRGDKKTKAPMPQTRRGGYCVARCAAMA
jgi:hypothetical protein